MFSKPFLEHYTVTLITYFKKTSRYLGIECPVSITVYWHILESGLKKVDYHFQGHQLGLKSGGAQRGGAENFGVFENHFSPSSIINDRT